ncbi:hypothetical protein BaRGS_00030664, partial [Batillaria attramentaria]
CDDSTTTSTYLPFPQSISPVPQIAALLDRQRPNTLIFRRARVKGEEIKADEEEGCFYNGLAMKYDALQPGEDKHDSQGC